MTRRCALLGGWRPTAILLVGGFVGMAVVAEHRAATTCAHHVCLAETYATVAGIHFTDLSAKLLAVSLGVSLLDGGVRTYRTANP